MKVCGITSEEDALLAVAVGADAVGFIFAPSQRQVSAGRVADIVKRLPAEVLTVGVFKNESTARIREIVNQTGLTAVQLHGAETPAMVREVKQDVRTVFKVVSPGSEAFERADEFGADAIMVDSPGGGTGQVFDWRLAEDAPAGVPLIMAGGLHPGNVAEAIAKVRPWGVDAATGTERSPGVKDPVLVRQFVQNARAAADPEPVPVDPSAPFAAEPYDWRHDVTWR